MICFIIDELSPCLKNTITGDIVETEVITLRRKSFLSKFNKRTNWYTDWATFDEDTVIKAVVIKGTVDIQGLVAMKDDPDSKAVHILWAVTSPNNNVWEFGAKKFPFGVPKHPYRIIVPEYSMSSIMEEYDYEDSGEQI